MTTQELSRNAIDFDHHSRVMAVDPWGRSTALRKNTPVAWTERHGGYWVVSRYEDVRKVLVSADTFSSAHEAPYETHELGGQSIPPYPFKISFVEMDPPESLQYRKLIQTEVLAKRVEAMKDIVRGLARECLEAGEKSGIIDLVMGYASQVAARSTLTILGLPDDHWRHYCDHDPGHTPTTEEQIAAAARAEEMYAWVGDQVTQRRQAPRDDLASRIVNGTVKGELLSLDEAINYIFVLVHGGVGTVSGVIQNTLHYLDADRDARAQLIARPELMTTATDEFMRYFSPARGVARTVIKDTELGGQALKKGDRVWLLLGSANHDEKVFPNAEKIILDRAPNAHVTFGYGAHLCVGQALARAELQILVNEMLSFAPDYAIDHANVSAYESTPMTTGFNRLPAWLHPDAHSRAARA